MRSNRRMRRPLLSGMLLILMFTGMPSTGTDHVASDGMAKTTAHPTPTLAPSEVTRIQLEALRSNTPINEGIALTFRFASPANKRVTGPLPRFARMLKSPPYDRLLNHTSVDYGPVRIIDDKAYQPIVVTDTEGQKVGFLWILSRQPDGQFKDCWMTDAVISSEQAAAQRFA